MTDRLKDVSRDELLAWAAEWERHGRLADHFAGVMPQEASAMADYRRRRDVVAAILRGLVALYDDGNEAGNHFWEALNGELLTIFPVVSTAASTPWAALGAALPPGGADHG